MRSHAGAWEREGRACVVSVMHELSVCQALVNQLEGLAQTHHAEKIEVVHLRIGILSGIEIPLLKHAFPIASAGTVAADARLEIETQAIEVYCSQCGQTSAVSANNLACPNCQNWQTEIKSGDEMLLVSVEMET